MNWLSIISIFILTIKGNIINIRKVLLLKKDHLKIGLEQSKTDNEYLYSFVISVKSENDSNSKISCVLRDDYFLKFNTQTYNIIDHAIENYLNSNQDHFETSKYFLKIRYLFRVFPDKTHLNSNDTKKNFFKKIFLTYKWLQKTPECDGITFRNNEIELRMFNIMQMFMRFVYVKPLRFDKYFIKFNKKEFKEKIEECKSFNLFYFKNFSECIESLEIFIKKYNCFYLIEDSNFDLRSEENEREDKDMKTSIKVSEFLNFMNNKFYQDHQELKRNNLLLNIVQRNFKVIFEKCRDHIGLKLIDRDVVLPIGGEYTIDYYLKEIYNFIYEFIKKTEINYHSYNLSNCDNLIRSILSSFKSNLLKFQKKAAKNFFKDGYFFKSHQKIETLNEVINFENKMCDYYNTMVYIIKLDLFPNEGINGKLSYLNPIFFDNDDFMIVRGFEIGIYNLEDIESIIALSENENDLILKENVHYFINEFKRILIPSDILKTLSVQELKITFYEKQFGKFYKVFTYYKI